MTESALHHQPNGAVADLRSLLLRFATPAEVLAHQVSENGQNPKSRLKLFLQTIDETVLPRLCTVSLNGVPLAELTLVDRRLGSVRMHVDTPNTTKKETAEKRFSRQLVGLSRSVGELTLTFQRTADKTNFGETFVSSSQILGALGLDCSGCPIDRLSELILPKAIGVAMWSETGAESEYSGELSWRKPLENLTERFLNAQNTRKSRHPFDQKNLMCMAVPLSSDLIVLLAYHGKKKIAAVLPEDLGLATLENWHFSVSDLHQ